MHHRLFGAIAASAVLIAAGSPANAALVAEWNFNSGAATMLSASTNNSTGAALVVGSALPFQTNLPDRTGSSADLNPVTINNGPNNSNALRTSPAPAALSGANPLDVKVSLVGFTTPKISWDFLAGYRTSRFYQIFATSDGANFAPVPTGVGSSASTTGVGSATVSPSGLITVLIDDTFIPNPAADPPTAPNYLNSLSFTFPSGTAFDNNPLFGVRIAPVYDTASNAFVSSFAGTPSTDISKGYTNSTVNGGGSQRYDLIRVEASPIPEPSALLVASVLMGAATLRRPRRA